MENLTKKQFADFWSEDGTLNGSAWQKAESRIALKCHYQKTGKNRGTRYNILEIYNTPKERVHGNKGREPINKGQVDKSSLKYQMAQTLIEMNLPGAYTRNEILGEMGFRSGNLKHFDEMFDAVNFHELDTIDQFAFNEIENLTTALIRLFGGAIGLIQRGIFASVSVNEELYYANSSNEHCEAEGLEELYLLYKQARLEAAEIVKQEYDSKLFFATRMYLNNIEYQALIKNEEKYKFLDENDIAYFYSKYEIVKPAKENSKYEYDFEVEDYDGAQHELEMWTDNEVIASDFYISFMEHRKANAMTNIDNLLIRGVESEHLNNFANKQIMIEFSNELFIFMFGYSPNYKSFKTAYDDLISEAKELYNTTFDEVIEDALSIL